MEVQQMLRPRPSRESIWTANFVLSCAASLMMLMSAQLLLPTLPLYLLKLGGKQSDVGFVMAAYTIAALVMRAVAGLLSDRRTAARRSWLPDS
jgi:MFS family permease